LPVTIDAWWQLSLVFAGVPRANEVSLSFVPPAKPPAMDKAAGFPYTIADLDPG
jgi:hypothetical protein